MLDADNARRNYLLAALPAADLEHLLPHLSEVKLELGHAVFESGSKPRYLYFPTSAVISLLYVTENGSSTEIALTGREGAIGIALFMGGESTPSRAVVQSAGTPCPSQFWRKTLPAAERAVVLLRYTRRSSRR